LASNFASSASDATPFWLTTSGIDDSTGGKAVPAVPAGGGGTAGASVP
jgi:hypothetical protein